MNGIMELMTANKWLIEPTFGLKAVRLLNIMAAGHLQEDNKKVYGVRCYEQADGSFAAYASDGEERSGGEMNVNEPFIDVLYLEGPLTREGGACTYGSRQLRDMMIAAADEEGCLGHLLLINGPGGVSNTIHDFLQATEYARSKGQPIVGRIDGFCASAHIWVSAMCDEVYYNNPNDQIGSVGVYWANILNKDGDIDPETNGRWHIVYDPESYDKNRFVRDLAENDDDTLIKEELIKEGQAFRDFIKERRPNVRKEHLHGKMFDVKDVEGILVDGQATMQEAMNRIVELRGKRMAGGGRGTATNTTGAAAMQQVATKTSVRMQAGAAKENILPTSNNINMKEKFPALFAALQVEEMQMQEGGAFMNEGLLATLNTAIEAKEKEAADAKALADQLTAEKAELEQKLETADGEYKAAIEKLNGEHAAALEEKGNAIAALEQEKADLQTQVREKQEALDATAADLAKATDDLNGANASLASAQGTIAERDQQISDLNAQLEELSQDPGEGAQAGADPANNGTGVEAVEVAISTQYVMDPSKSYEENMRAKKEWEAARK